MAGRGRNDQIEEMQAREAKMKSYRWGGREQCEQRL